MPFKKTQSRVFQLKRAKKRSVFSHTGCSSNEMFAIVQEDVIQSSVSSLGLGQRNALTVSGNYITAASHYCDVDTLSRTWITAPRSQMPTYLRTWIHVTGVHPQTAMMQPPPLISPLSSAPPFLTGIRRYHPRVRGYHPQKIVGIKDACKRVLEHFRHRHRRI